MIKVVSVALFGSAAPDYAKYIPALLRGQLNLFPLREGWQLRIHVDSQVASSDTGALIRRYAAEGLCQSVLVYGTTKATPPLCKAMLWRLGPVFDPAVEYVFARDLDAPLMPRDVYCCNQFIASKTAVHTIHDSDQHIGIMGGLSGYWAPEFRRIAGLQRLEDLHALAELSEAAWDKKGADQYALNKLLALRPQLTLLEHRYNGWHEGAGKKPVREPGQYPCEAWSTKMSDVGTAGACHWVFQDKADRLGAHLGCAGYDHAAAVSFWDEYGDPGYAAVLRKCEGK